MKRIELVSLRLKNFKGVKNFTIEANGQNVRVFGDNATGKTTLFDAMTWLLFDKDSNNKKDFQIKTVDLQGKELHGLEHEVEGVFLVDGKTLTLKKVFKEKWTKKKGGGTKKFSGHTTDYYIDEVPTKQKEFKDKVDDLIDEKIFKLLTSPTYFNEQLKKEEKRNILFEVCGTISDEEIISSSKKLSELEDILGNRGIEKHKEFIAAKRKEINKELDAIEVRIKEVNHNLPDINSLNGKELLAELTFLDDDIRSKEDEISRIRNGGQVSEKQKELAQLQADLLKIKNNYNADTQEKLRAKESLFNEVRTKRDEVEYEINSAKRNIQTKNEEIQRLEKQAEHLREQFFEVDSRQFTGELHQHDENCLTCGQSLPQDQIEEAHQKAKEKYESELADFNRKKAEELESIRSRGKETKSQITALGEEAEELSAFAEEKDNLRLQYEERLSTLQDEISDLKANMSNVEESTEYKRKMDEIERVKTEISGLKSSVSEEISKAQNELDEIKVKKREVEEDLAKIKQHKQAEKRIQELSDQESKLGAEFEKLEKEKYLIEQFTRTKIDMIEEKIASKFKYARFKLFKELISGGLEDVCETLFDGVEYSKGLNNAARINVGLDIISTLSKHYGFSAPIFIDNSEAVTKLIDTKAQTISLVVSEKDKVLRIELPEKEHKEAV